MVLRKKIALWVSQQRQLPYRLRKSIVKSAYPSILKDHKFEVDFYGLRYAGNTSNSTDRLFFMFGGCERYMLSLFRDYCNAQKSDGLVFMDVGAHAGNHALFMSQYVKEVHAFEPNPIVRESMEANVKLNKIRNINIYSLGLSNVNELIPFYVPKKDHLSCGSFCSDHDERNEYFADLEVRVGDDVVQEKVINHVDIIKIDVEGFERRVVEGLTKTMASSRPMVIIEVSKTTRGEFGSKNDFESIFPEDYCFYQFSGVSREKEVYKLASFDYGLHDGHLDVIAVPKEKLAYVGDSVVSTLKRNKVVGG